MLERGSINEFSSKSNHVFKQCSSSCGGQKAFLNVYHEVMGLKVLKETDRLVHLTADGKNT